MEETQQTQQQEPAVPEPAKPKKKSGFSRFVKFCLVIFIIWWFSNDTVKITKQKIISDKVSNDIKITVLSDYHASEMPFSLKNDYVLKKIRKTKPDIVCILGDMHSSNATDSEKDKSLSLMTCIAKEGFRVYFVLGEHDDRSNYYISLMESRGINVLSGEKDTVKIGNTSVNLYGISNAYFAPSFDLRNEFDIDKKQFNILLAHIPMYSDYEKFGADLTICGDTHGGVIRIPGIGPAYCNDMFFPELRTDDPVYDKGLFPYSGGNMFITSGLGSYIRDKVVPVRLFNRPEIASITISPS